MKIFARYELAEGQLEAGDDALLLEGEWPSSARDSSQVAGARRSIESSAANNDVDAVQQADQACTELFRQLCPLPDHIASGSITKNTVAYLDAGRLRSYLARLIRLSDVLPTLLGPATPGFWQLFIERERDWEYEFLIRQIAKRHAVRLMVVELATARDSSAEPFQGPAIELPFGRQLSQLLTASDSRFRSEARCRVVFCGHPKTLEPLCRALLERRAHVYWIHDRFAVKQWVRWRALRVEQLLCDSLDAVHLDAEGHWPAAPVSHNSLDLTASLAWFMDRQCRRHAARYARLIERMVEHLRRVRPVHLVIDQDHRPLERAALAVARELEIASTVLQRPATREATFPDGQNVAARLADDLLKQCGQNCI